MLISCRLYQDMVKNCDDGEINRLNSMEGIKPFQRGCLDLGGLMPVIRQQTHHLSGGKKANFSLKSIKRIKMFLEKTYITHRPIRPGEKPPTILPYYVSAVISQIFSWVYFPPARPASSHYFYAKWNCKG